jgi:hypothetical protein
MSGQKAAVPNTPAEPYVPHFCSPLWFSHSLYSKSLIFEVCLFSICLAFYIVFISVCFITSPHFEMLVFSRRQVIITLKPAKRFIDMLHQNQK